MKYKKFPETKICKTCGIEKPINKFALYHKKTHLYYFCHCQQCTNIKRKKERLANPEKAKACYRKSYYKNREQVLRSAANQREKLRTAVFERYGEECTCCGISDRRFLTIDHILPPKNKSNYEKKGLYQWLKSNGYPSGFQTLCWNCNMAKRIYLSCPHKQDGLLNLSFDRSSPNGSTS